MEPGSRGVAGAQSDCLLRRPDHSWHACNRVSTAAPGLPPIDYSRWRLLPPGAPASGGATAPPQLPGVRRSAGLWGTVKRIAGAPRPGRLAQQMPTLPPTMPCTPQTAPVQPPHPAGLATPYQQAVQLPKRPVWRGVIADTPTGKITPMGGTMQDCRRPAVRGRGHSSRSVSHPRGVPEMMGVQPQCQEGGLPSGSTPGGRSLSPPPPPPVPERTKPLRRGSKRSALRDPARLVANFHSSGWRKDLEHILKVYYKYSVDYFTEGDWFQVKERFFDLFLQHKKEALEVKEAHPLDFMAYIQDLFYQATSVHLDGLGSFTRWIKRGSYYHGIVAQQGRLKECPHLAGAPLPRWPQVAPSESHRESHMRSDAQVPSSSRPSEGAMAVLVAETPIAEASEEETDVMETPAETPGAEALIAHSILPAPMETGGVGDGSSWAEQMEAREEEFQRSRPAKCPHSQSRRHEPTPRLPFPLQDEGRFASVAWLYEHAAAQPATPHNVAGQAIRHLHPNLLPQQATSLGNQVACMIAEYHLTVSARQSSLHPILPHEVAPLLPPIKTYVPGVSFEGTQDVRVMDHAMALRVAVWLHRLNMAMGGEALASESLEARQHHLGPLLESFLTPRMSGLTYQEVVDQVLMENRRAADQSLRHLQEHRTREREVLEGLIKAHGELNKADKAARKSLKKEINQRRKGLETLKERISHYESQLGQEPSEGGAPREDSQTRHGAQSEVVPAPVADDASSKSAAIPAPDPSPAEDPAQAMEVDDYAACPSLSSPVSREEDEILTGLPQSEATEVASGLAHLMVSSPRGPNEESGEASL